MRLGNQATEIGVTLAAFGEQGERYGTQIAREAMAQGQLNAGDPAKDQRWHMPGRIP